MAASQVDIDTFEATFLKEFILQEEKKLLSTLSQFLSMHNMEGDQEIHTCMEAFDSARRALHACYDKLVETLSGESESSRARAGKNVTTSAGSVQCTQRVAPAMDVACRSNSHKTLDLVMQEATHTGIHHRNATHSPSNGSRKGHDTLAGCTSRGIPRTENNVAADLEAAIHARNEAWKCLCIHAGRVVSSCSVEAVEEARFWLSRELCDDNLARIEAWSLSPEDAATAFEEGMYASKNETVCVYVSVGVCRLEKIRYSIGVCIVWYICMYVCMYVCMCVCFTELERSFCIDNICVRI